MSRIIATLILFTSLLSNVTQSAADTGVCLFGDDKHKFNFYEPHNCKSGDTAIYSFTPNYLSEPGHFTAYICDLDKKIVEGGVVDDEFDFERGYIICTFLRKVVRE